MTVTDRKNFRFERIACPHTCVCVCDSVHESVCVCVEGGDLGVKLGGTQPEAAKHRNTEIGRSSRSSRRSSDSANWFPISFRFAREARVAVSVAVAAAAATVVAAAAAATNTTTTTSSVVTSLVKFLIFCANLRLICAAFCYLLSSKCVFVYFLLLLCLFCFTLAATGQPAFFHSFCLCVWAWVWAQLQSQLSLSRRTAAFFASLGKILFFYARSR